VIRRILVGSGGREDRRNCRQAQSGRIGSQRCRKTQYRVGYAPPLEFLIVEQREEDQYRLSRKVS